MTTLTLFAFVVTPAAVTDTCPLLVIDGRVYRIVDHVEARSASDCEWLPILYVENVRAAPPKEPLKNPKRSSP